jgi:hypothetical protein
METELPFIYNLPCPITNFQEHSMISEISTILLNQIKQYTGKWITIALQVIIQSFQYKCA